MSDNLNASGQISGVYEAADDLGSNVKVQRVKLMLGADGVNDGDVSAANPIPVVATASSVVLGKVSIDQTTPGTTDSVTIKASDGIGSLTETAPATDTASSGLNGRLQRIAQRVTWLGALLPAALTSAGSLKNSIEEFIYSSTTMQNAVSATANGTTLDVQGKAVAVLQVSGTFVATVNFEASNDDTNWFPINATQIGADALVTSTASTGLFRLSVAGLKSVRARVTWTSGTSITVIGKATTADSHAKVVSTILQGHSATVTITRPSDTTAYAAGDVIGDTNGSAIFTFANIARAAGEIIITSVELEIDAAAVPSGMSGFNLRLYNAAPTAIADNAAWDIPSGDRGKYLGKISLGTPIDEGSTLFIDNDGNNKQITLTSANLYVELQTVGAFTPTSASIKKLTIHTMDV